MFTQRIDELFATPDTPASTDFVLQSINALQDDRIPSGKALCIVANNRLLNWSNQQPPRKNKNEQWWLADSGDVQCKLSVEHDGRTFSVTVKICFETDADLLNLLASVDSLTRDELGCLVSSHLAGLLKLSAVSVDAVLAAEDAARENLRARLSLALQNFGMRCTELAAFFELHEERDADSVLKADEESAASYRPHDQEAEITEADKCRFRGIELRLQTIDRPKTQPASTPADNRSMKTSVRRPSTWWMFSLQATDARLREYLGRSVQQIRAFFDGQRGSLAISELRQLRHVESQLRFVEVLLETNPTLKSRTAQRLGRTRIGQLVGHVEHAATISESIHRELRYWPQNAKRTESWPRACRNVSRLLEALILELQQRRTIFH